MLEGFGAGRNGCAQTTAAVSRVIDTHLFCLALPKYRRRELQILSFGHAPDGESNDVNHAEAEFFLQAVNEIKVRVCEPDSSRF